MLDVDKEALALAMLEMDACLMIAHYRIVATNGWFDIYFDYPKKSSYISTRQTLAEAIEFVKMQIGD